MRTLIAIPVYNEEQTLAEVIERTRPHADDILVVDDGSTDATADVLARTPDIATITHPTNRGYGQTLIDAFGYSVDNDYDVVITVDADTQHEPEYIPCFLAAMPGMDVVSGTRYPRGFGRVDDAPADRVDINSEITAVIRQHTGYPLTDGFCGYKAYRVAALAKLRLREPGYGMCLEFWIKAAAAGLLVREIPVNRLYVNPYRTFGGHLDEARRRLEYYHAVIADAVRDVARRRQPLPCSACNSCPGS